MTVDGLIEKDVDPYLFDDDDWVKTLDNKGI